MGDVQGLDTPAYLLPRIREWLLILPISDRLYTSVNPLDPEIHRLKESWPTDLSPTALFDSRDTPRGSTDVMGPTGMVGEGCTRGSGDEGRLGGLYRVLPRYPPRTHIYHIPGLRPYLRPNEAKFKTFHEVS